MKIFLSALVFLFFLMMSCGKDQNLPNKLPGKWTDDNQRITFNSNSEFGVKYLRIGNGVDTVYVDSVWGNYILDSKRNNLSFYQKGFRNRDGSLVIRDLNSETWNVKFLTDTTFRYESNTTVGFMKKVLR